MLFNDIMRNIVGDYQEKSQCDGTLYYMCGGIFSFYGNRTTRCPVIHQIVVFVFVFLLDSQ